jgi:site-specific recombinase XerD
LYNFQHTFGRWLVQSGISIYEISKLLGPSEINVEEIDAQLGVDDLSKSIEKIN